MKVFQSMANSTKEKKYIYSPPCHRSNKSEFRTYANRKNKKSIFLVGVPLSLQPFQHLFFFFFSWKASFSKWMFGAQTAMNNI